MNINIYIHTYSTYIYIYVLYITCVSLISQRISRLPQEKHMVHPLKAGRSHAASRAAFNRWFTRASKDWYLVRCAVNENSLVEERIFYLLVRFTSGIFGNDPFITINNNPSNPQQPIHSLHLAPVSLCSWIMIIYDNPMIIHRKYMKASRHNPTINQQWCSRMLNRRCCWKCCWNDLKLWDPLLGGSKLFTA